MPRQSAGILPYRRRNESLEVLLAHHGGPYWTDKDEGAWTIVKGEYGGDEAPFDAAIREFTEETGHRPNGTFIELATRKQKGGKIVSAWAVEMDWDPALLTCNTFRMEWPPKSGQFKQFPEVDRAAWFDFPEATRRILASQVGFLQELYERLTGETLAPVAAE